MLVVIVKERLQAMIEDEIKCWGNVSGGPNLDAFDFNPRETDPKLLEELGYYADKQAWIAGVRIKFLKDYLAEVQALPQFNGK